MLKRTRRVTNNSRHRDYIIDHVGVCPKRARLLHVISFLSVNHHANCTGLRDALLRRLKTSKIYLEALESSLSKNKQGTECLFPYKKIMSSTIKTQTLVLQNVQGLIQ